MAPTGSSAASDRRTASNRPRSPSAAWLETRGSSLQAAQRTGATTYYLEIFPQERKSLGGKEPVLSLTPSPGNVDIMVASELVEAGRAMQNGYVSPERTTLVASTHRIYATIEKMQMADGRFDSERVIEAGRQLAKRAVLFDMRKRKGACKDDQKSPSDWDSEQAGNAGSSPAAPTNRSFVQGSGRHT
jgi:hypothetical protein